jgi:hypothetical protein
MLHRKARAAASIVIKICQIGAAGSDSRGQARDRSAGRGFAERRDMQRPASGTARAIFT